MRETLVKTEEFKDSPTEKMPEGWEVKPLREIADLQVGFAFKSEWFQEHEGIRLLRGENVGYGSPDWSETRRLPWKMCPNYQEYELVAGEIIIGMDRTFTKSGFKISVLKPDDVPALLVQRVGRFIPINCDHQFLKVLLNSQEYHHALLAQQKGMDIPHLSKTEILEPVVAVPPVDEQRQIAEILNTIDEAIAHTSSLIAKLKQMKAGLLHDLLTRGLDENGELRDAIAHPEQFKESALGLISKDWEVCQLSDFYAVPARNGLYKPAKFYGRGVLMIHMPQMFRGLTIDVSDAARVYVNPSELERFSLAVGDLVFARRSLNLEGAGRCSLVPALSEPTTFESSIIRVRLSTDKLRPIFANYFLNSETGFRLRLPLIRQVAVSGVSSEDIASIPVPCPPPEEQDAIIKIIDTHNTRIRAEEAYRDKLKLQKQGLMHDLLTGKVRVEAK